MKLFKNLLIVIGIGIFNISFANEVLNANETILSDLAVKGYASTLALGQDALSQIEKSKQYIEMLDKKIIKANNLLKQYERQYEILFNKQAKSLGKISNIDAKFKNVSKILTNTKNQLSSNKTALSKIVSNLNSGIQKTAKGVGKVMDIATVINSINTLTQDSKSLMDKSGAVKDIASTIISNATKNGGALVLFDLTMTGVDVAFDSARNTASDITDMMLKDWTRYKDNKRAIVTNAILNNPNATNDEIVKIAQPQIQSMQDEYFEAYKSDGYMYKTVYGDGITKLAAGMGHMASGSSDIERYNTNLELFGETINEHIVEDLVIKKQSQIQKIKNEEREIINTFADINNEYTVTVNNINQGFDDISNNTQNLSNNLNNADKLAELKEKILTNYEEKQAEQLAETEITEPTENKELNQKKQQAQQLKDKNNQLVSEYNELYLEYIANPNATNKAKLDAKGDELNTNAREFVQARTEAINLSGGTLAKNDIGFVDDVAITTRKINDDNPNLADDLAQNSENRAEILAALKEKILARYKQEQAQQEQIAEIRTAENSAKLKQQMLNKQQDQFELATQIGDKNKKLRDINNKINSKQSQINKLRNRLANLSSGNNNPVDKYLVARVKYIKSVYDKYNGDVSQLNSKERSIIATLSKKFNTHWIDLFNGINSRYDSVINQPITSGNSNEAQQIQAQINTLQNEIRSLENSANIINQEKQFILANYNQGAKELEDILNDINNDDKQEIITDDTQRAFYGFASFISKYDSEGPHAGDVPILTKNNFSKDNQDTDFRAGSDSYYITKNVQTGSGDHFDGYNYVAWGKWAGGLYQGVEEMTDGEVQTFDVLANSGYWVLGQEAYDVPKTGSANYRGEMIGNWVDASGNAQAGALSGDMNFAVNFASNNISGSGNIKVNNNQIDSWNMSPVELGGDNLVDRDGIKWQFGSVDFSYWFAGENRYTGENFVSTTNDNSKLSIYGSLNGKGGSEVSGGIYYKENVDDGVSAGRGSGIFRAKQ